jgi:PhzF family phenazine biosynthesis protein
MGLEFYCVDAFTSEKFRGNPACVVLCSESLPEEYMQSIAAEMNLSETVFLERKGNNEYSIRWFTPTVEVPLCGHGTISAAHVLFNEECVSEKSLIFSSASGILESFRNDNEITIVFPTVSSYSCNGHNQISDLLGIEIIDWREGEGFMICRTEEEHTVYDFKPDFQKILEFTKKDVFVTAVSKSKDFDFVTRVFAPGTGINEDPVTGSAYTALAPYYSELLNKKDMKAFQASERGGYLSLVLTDDKVHISGECVTVYKGEFV